VWMYSLHFFARRESKNGSITRKYLIATGVICGLAAGTKWSGAFLLPTFAVLESAWYGSQIYQRQSRERKIFVHKMLNYIPLYVLTFILIPPAIYILSYSHMFIQGKNFQHFKDMHQQIWWYQTTLDATHPYQSRPWEWALNLRPVWYHIENNARGERGDIYAFGNTALYWFGLMGIFATSIYWLRNIGTKLSKTSIVEIHALGIVLTSYILSWTPWFASPRIMFFYHYTPAVPFMSILLAFWTLKLWDGNKVQRFFAIACVLLICATFVIWYPHWMGIPVPEWLKENVYFMIERWR
ncbi:MAG: phospholipid carrier-dependent glycosyltransferase, partial [Microgenomates group bacterium]